MITRPATGYTPPGSDLIDPPTWSLRGFRLFAPALIAACRSGDGDTITDLCAAPEPPPGLAGGVAADPLDKEQ